jgi:hypothetical protein
MSGRNVSPRDVCASRAFADFVERQDRDAPTAFPFEFSLCPDCDHNDFG